MFTLLVLERLMAEIAHLEENADPECHHSFCPQEFPSELNELYKTSEHYRRSSQYSQRRFDDASSEEKLDLLPRERRFLPCHYFDYMCGSSTGS